MTVGLRYSAGPVLRHCRETAGLSREQLASTLGRTTATIANWESGKVRPPRHLVIRLSRVLGVDFALLEDAPSTDLDAVRDLVAQSRAAQGLPPTVEDEATIRRVVAALAGRDGMTGVLDDRASA